MLAGALAIVLTLLSEDPAGATSVSAPAAQPAAAAPVLRVIGRERATTPFCSALVSHFNNSVGPMVQNDLKLGAIDYTLGGLKDHFQDPARDLKLSDDRVRLMSYVAAIQQNEADLQNEINQLRNAQKLTTDTGEQQLAHDLAADLQKSLDRQKQMAYDTSGVTQAMLELSPAMNYGESLDRFKEAVHPPIAEYYFAEVANAYTREISESVLQEPPDVRMVLATQRLLDRIGDAENGAAALARQADDHCGPAVR